MIKVSIVIPVYNTAQFLEKSIGSVLNQTLTDIEVIAVNNGSTDGSGDILRKIANKDNRLRIYDISRPDVAAARNEGLRHVKGKYLYFLDSDDEILPNALETCFKYCEQNDLDFVTFDAARIIKDGDTSNIQNYDRSNAKMEEKIWNGSELLNHQINSGAFRGSLWLMFCRTKFVTSCFCHFAEGFIHEDQRFVVTTYIKARRTMYIPHCLYNRTVRCASIMTKTFSMRNVQGYSGNVIL